LGGKTSSKLAKAYKLPEPVFLERAKDDYDFLIEGKTIDLKTKSEKTKDFLINIPQYERKKGKIDIFVFGEIYGDYFRVVGWVEYDRVPEISRKILFPNGSRAWALKKRELKKIADLIV